MHKSKYLVFVGLLVLLLAAVGYWRYAPPAYAGADESLTETEEALSLPETFLLASLDVDYLNALRDRYYGRATAPDLPASVDSTASTDEILRAVIEASGATSRASVAVYGTGKGGLGTALVLEGRFAPQSVADAMSRYWQVAPMPDQPNTWSVRFENTETCELSEPWTVQATNERVIAVARDDRAMLARLRDKAKAGRDLTRWREFRRDRFAAAAVFLPDAVPEGGIDPLLRMGVDAAQEGLQGFESIYVGAAIDRFLPSGELTLLLAAKTPQTASEKARTWREKIAASRAEWSKLMPTVAALHDHASIETQSNVVIANIRVDRRLAGELRQLPTEILGQMFGGLGMQTRASEANEPEQEQIDKKPREFQAETSIATLAPFNRDAPFVDAPAATTGPFGVALTGIRLTGSESRLLELELRATGTQLLNVGDDTASMMAFSIESVQDSQGRDLLRAERCGRDRNSLPGRPQFSMNEHLQATKKVRLIENARQSDVATIKGTIRLRLPTAVETVAVRDPKIGDRLERDELRVELTQVNASSIGYRASGAVDRLLHLRAKNARGEVLSRGGSMSSGDQAKSVRNEFRGKIASIEWVVASEIEERDFAFEIHGARLSAQDGWTDRNDQPFHVYSKAELARDLASAVQPKRFGTPLASTMAGPVPLDLTHIGSFGNLRLDFLLTAPLLKNLDGSLSAAQIQLDALTFSDGSVERPAENSVSWFSLVALDRFGEDPYSGDASIDTGFEIAQRDLSTVSGRVLVRVPRGVESVALSTSEVGSHIDTACGPVSLTEVSQVGLSFEGTGDAACIYAAHAFGADGKEMKLMDASIATHPGGWLAKATTNGAPNLLEIAVAKDVERIEFPFEMQIQQR